MAGGGQPVKLLMKRKIYGLSDIESAQPYFQ